MNARNPSSWAALILAILSSAARTEEAKPGVVDTQALAEVRWLSEFPPGLLTALGRQKKGPDGMADVKESFNSSGVINNRLPLRRFLLGGLSANAALVAYEQGGPDHRLHPYHVSTYIRGRSDWRQTGAWLISEFPVTLRQIIWAVQHAAAAPHPSLRVRPIRRDGPLREANLSDDEVREIQAVAHGVVPDTLVNISGVVSGCPCEEGAACSDQVWIVAYSPGVMKGLQLSKIGGRWAIGPVQQWWLDFDGLFDRRKDFASWSEFYAARDRLSDRYPACVSSPKSSGAAMAPLTENGPRSGSSHS